MSSHTFLSFNSSIAEAANLDDLTNSIEKLDSNKPLELKYTWKLWEQIETPNTRSSHQQYSDNMKELTTFKTVQEFWEVWNQLPQPSALLMQKRMIRKDTNGVQQEVDALMIFKDGIRPMWEDPANKTGGHLEYKFYPNSHEKGQIDEYWNNLVLAMIGDVLESGQLLTGVRMVDKLNISKSPMLRIEVWYRSCTDEELQHLTNDVKKCMARHLDGTSGPLPYCDTKDHGGHK